MSNCTQTMWLTIHKSLLCAQRALKKMFLSLKNFTQVLNVNATAHIKADEVWLLTPADFCPFLSSSGS